MEGCDHADGAPAACLVAGKADRIARPEGARYDIVRGAPRSRVIVPAQCQTRHPDGAGFSACPDGASVAVAESRCCSGAEWSFRHNVIPGTPLGCGFFVFGGFRDEKIREATGPPVDFRFD